MDEGERQQRERGCAMTEEGIKGLGQIWKAGATRKEARKLVEECSHRAPPLGGERTV